MDALIHIKLQGLNADKDIVNLTSLLLSLSEGGLHFPKDRFLNHVSVWLDIKNRSFTRNYNLIVYWIAENNIRCKLFYITSDISLYQKFIHCYRFANSFPYLTITPKTAPTAIEALEYYTLYIKNHEIFKNDQNEILHERQLIASGSMLPEERPQNEFLNALKFNDDDVFLRQRNLVDLQIKYSEHTILKDRIKTELEISIEKNKSEMALALKTQENDNALTILEINNKKEIELAKMKSEFRTRLMLTVSISVIIIFVIILFI